MASQARHEEVRLQTLEGKFPSTLEELIPRELESIPDTGMAGFLSFEYVGPLDETVEKRYRLFATYELRASLYKLLQQFDCLVYW